ncbi:hypothetical protein E4J89_16850 [Arthrobacter sp. CAU 1506]|uniref:aromatic-ring-hydroxylating dioxygenase subunit beta n=1 Tax=Arthrobacter sp. CAU 1506 TaxID=2560052 RepID=UPI0010AD4FF3|nr:aromatic-ring-hydroxylating dioxygenase subunit beta [Arthrobacter sp. CAU 1506]TJY66263.1 hypothetical protein E4J89_16850 [Arthrobacter sp. CAU 1506]
MTEILESSVTGSGVSVSDPRIVRTINLIWREADLLDRKDYSAWGQLYAEDALYVIPIDTSIEDFDNVLNLVYDDARMRALRIQRFTEGYAISAVDSARTVRTVSRFVPGSASEDMMTLRAAQILVAYKRGTYDIWAADVDFQIRLGDEPTSDRIVKKVVRLVDAEDMVPAAGFLL